MWRWGTVVVAGMLGTARTPVSLPLSSPMLNALEAKSSRVEARSAPRFARALDSLDATGYATMVAAHRGHVLIVDFWATWCSPCRDEMPGLIALTGRYPKRDLQMATVSADGDAQMDEAKQFLDSVHAPATRYIKRTNDDDRFIQAVDSAWTGALPAIFVYDRQGHKVGTFFGETSVDSVAAVVRLALKS